MGPGFSFWYQKASNANKEGFCCAEPSRLLLPNLPLRTAKAKKKVKFFYSDNFVLP
jgi:hypothetical protein